MAAGKPRKPLDQDRVVEVAAALIDRDGLAEFSMRKLARELGVEPMSLYYWFPSKDHVMDALVDRFAGRTLVATGGPWEEDLAALARSFRAAALANPALFPYLAMHRFNTLSGLGVIEAILSVIARVHRDEATRASAFRLYIHWLLGFCLDETNGFAKGPSAQDPPSDEVVAERFPLVVELGPYNRPEHFDALFEAGLAATIAGVRAMDARGATGAPAGVAR